MLTCANSFTPYDRASNPVIGRVLTISIVNFCVMTCPDESQHGRLKIEDYEKEALARGIDFGKFGTAYAVEHSTRPSTIGFVLSSSPLALLAWLVSRGGLQALVLTRTRRIGEKFLTWTDTTPSMDEILASVTLYWLTSTFPRSIYPYRQVGSCPSPQPVSKLMV